MTSEVIVCSFHINVGFQSIPTAQNYGDNYIVKQISIRKIKNTKKSCLQSIMQINLDAAYKLSTTQGHVT